MKKIISLFIAITLILALCPLSFAAETFKGYTYVFSKDVFGSSATVWRDKLAEMTFETPRSSLSAPWKMALSRALSNVYSTENGIGWMAGVHATKGIRAFGIEIFVENGGEYTPSLTYWKNKSMPIVDIHLVKENTMSGGFSTADLNFSATNLNGDGIESAGYTYMNRIGENGKLGTVNMWGTSAVQTFDVQYTKDFENVKLDKGKYYLLFSTVGSQDGEEGKYEPNSQGFFEVWLNSFSLEYVPSEADKAFDYTAEKYETTPEATVTALAAYGNGEAVKDADVISVKPVTYGQKCNVSVNNKTVVKEGKTYNFLYWAKGMTTRENESALSTSESFDYMTQDGNNVLIAVYEETGTDKAATFYNANGQLLDLTLTAENKLPDLPSMAGYTAPATAWVQLGNDAELKAGDAVPETGDKIFMAKYDVADKKTNISVTVNGKESKVDYGAKIECPTPTPGTDEVFMYWTKTVGGASEAEIVSMDEEYSFYAWENCEVTAKYGPAKPSLAKDMRKIIISSVEAGNENAIMAEFIGLGDALEKGVMIGNRKIAMTTDNPQFTVVVGAGDTVTGYAIVGNATDGYKQITDK